MSVNTLQRKRAVRNALLILLLCVAGLTNAFAQTFTVGNLNYSINGDGTSVTVTGLSDSQSFDGELVIPESVELYGTSYLVTAIASYAFQYYSNLTSVTFGSSVTQIGSWAFLDCWNLSTVTIPESMTSMGAGVFYGSGLVSVEYNAINCYKNSSGTVGGNPAYWFNGTPLTTLTIGENVERIPDHFVNGCSNIIGELVIPESVTYIGSNAFNSCSGFTGSLTIPNSVSSIGTNAFSGCSGFSGTLTLGMSLSEIGNSAFFGACENFTSFDVKPETPPTLGSNVFTSVDYGIPVQVPCGSGADYVASDWEMFTNIQEPDPCMWEIMATADPEEGGTVSGVGTHEQGTTCTLTATPNEGYFFVNWTEDGMEVSADEEYSFTVEGNRNLVAHFVMPTFVITAIANPSYAGEICGFDVSDQTFDFEDGQIPANWVNSTSYPWTVTTSNGSLCMKSGNGGVASSTSAIEVTVMFVEDGTVSFLGGCWGEGQSWDVCKFFIDDVQQFSYGNLQYWSTYSYDVSAGTHTFRWSYSKDDSVNPAGDAFFVDDVTFTGIAGNVFHLDELCTLTATPISDDYVFVNWTEDGEVVSTNAQYSFNVTSDRDLVANFMQIRFEITASANPEEGGSIEGTGNYMVGQTCTLTATPSEGCTFINWTENDEEVSTNAEYTFVVAGSRDLVANFALPNYTITATANPIEGGNVGFANEGFLSQYDFDDGTLQGWTSIDADGDGYGWEVNYGNDAHGNNGSNGFAFSRSWINPNILYPDNYLVSPQFTFGSCITFYACAQDNGYAAEHFGVAVSTGGNTDPNDFTTIQEWTMSAKGGGMPSDVTRSGNRAQGNWYKYTVNLGEYAGQTGYIAIRHFNCWDMFWINIDDIVLQLPEEITETFMAGSTCTVTAIPNYGYALGSWMENGDVVSTEEAYSFTVTGDRSLVANFVKVPFSITATPNFEDWGTVSGMGEYVIDTTCTLTATPADGHNFVHWLENGQVVSTDAEYTFTVTGPKDLVAVFSPLEGTYIVFADPKVETICVNHWDADGDGFLSYEEAAVVTNLGNVFEYNHEITSFDELQYFTGLTFFNEYEFYYCDNLTSVGLPENVTSIGYAAFGNCYSLSGSLTIGENVNYIGGGAFYHTHFTTLNFNAVNCEVVSWWLESATDSLTTLNIGENVEVIPAGVFSNCYNVTGDLVIPNSVTYIGGYAFEDCSSFTSITIPEGITTIEYGTFAYCSSAETINLPSALDTIGGYAFAGCNSLTSIELPNTLSYIGYQAFENCSALTGVLEIPAPVTYIGDEAFHNCTNLTAVVLSDSLQFIGYRAFQNCSGLRGELTLPESLEFVGNNAFAGCDGLSAVNYNAINCQTMGSAGEPVFYDCAFAHLRIGENVESIPDFAFKHCFLITDIATGAVNPPTIYASTFGMVPRSIPVSVPLGSGDAYRSAQYWEEFFNINEDYSPSQYTYHWSVNINQFESNMTAIGVIQIDGEEQATDKWEIGAFCGNECRGRQLLAYYPEIDRYLVFLTLYGEDGDLLTFRLYDHEAGTESPLGCTSHLAFEPDAIVGTVSEPHVFNFTNMQVSFFPEGWTWWSSYIEQDGNDGLGQLEEGLGQNGLIIKSQANGYVTYTPALDLWTGNLDAIDNVSTYLINATAACVANIAGETASPSAHLVTLSTGWNWIGYPCGYAMNINTALGGIEPAENDMLKAQEGFSVYQPELGWIGTLQSITPGMGLMYRSFNNETVTLTYPEATRSEVLAANVTARGNHWEPDAHAYSYNMSVIAVVELDGMEIGGGNYELAAFANGECRGSAKLAFVEAIGRYVAFLTVYGEDAAALSFGLYDAETGMERFDAEESLVFAGNAIVGSLGEPYTVSFRGTMGLDDFGSTVTVFPNPVEPGQSFRIGMSAEDSGKVRVEIVNALGVVETLRATSLQTVVAPTVPGVYTLRVTVDGKGTCFKKLVVR